MRKSTGKIYMSRAKNGARAMFDIEDYRLVDGVSFSDKTFKEVQSYFIIHFGEEKRYFRLDAKEAYNLLALYVLFTEDRIESDFIIETIQKGICKAMRTRLNTRMMRCF